MQAASPKLLVFTAFGTIFGCLSAIVSRCAFVGAAAAAKAALSADVIAVMFVAALVFLSWLKDHGPLPESDEDNEAANAALKKRLEVRTARACAIVVAGIMLFGAISGAFYAQAGGVYLLAGMVVGVTTTLIGLRAQLDYIYPPSLLLIIFLAESGLILLCTPR